MTFKIMTEQNLEFPSLKGGCICSSESSLVKMPHCWKSHVTAHISENKLQCPAVAGYYAVPAVLLLAFVVAQVDG